MKKGFTLMEVLVVVVIVGILSSVAMPQYRKIVERGKFTKAQAMAKAMYDSCGRLAAVWGVEDRASLPEHVRNAGISRLDIGSPSLLPAGFVCYPANCVGGTIKGAGYEFVFRENNCNVSIRKVSGTYKANMVYNGTSFTCTNVDAEACTVYGLD